MSNLRSQMTTKEIADMIRGMARTLGEDLSSMTDAEIVNGIRRLVQSGAADKARARHSL